MEKTLKILNLLDLMHEPLPLTFIKSCTSDVHASSNKLNAFLYYLLKKGYISRRGARKKYEYFLTAEGRKVLSNHRTLNVLNQILESENNVTD